MRAALDGPADLFYHDVNDIKDNYRINLNTILDENLFPLVTVRATKMMTFSG